MYNLQEIGQRIAIYRRNLGLTQEELASRLGITAQAVSKWENEISFPDIGILPMLAKELNTTIDKLFGNNCQESNLSTGTTPLPFREELQGYGNEENHLKLVLSFRNVGCYSDKEVLQTSEDTVNFKDGSSANLRQLLVVNKGPGDIRFEFIEEAMLYEAQMLHLEGETELTQEYEGIDSLILTINQAQCFVERSQNAKTYIKATGSPVFIHGLKTNMNKAGTQLTISCPQQNNSGASNNKVDILFGSDYGKSIQVLINGNGSGKVNVPFEIGTFSVNGSGMLSVLRANSFEGRINGSGDISCGIIGDPQIHINGSGDVDANVVYGSVKCIVNGSGDINLKANDTDSVLDNFETVIKGSGDISAGNITTKHANISIDGSGDIVIGRVIEESVEKHSKNSSIRVLKRG